MRQRKTMPSLRWIHENLEPPNVEEESSDIDDSCSSDGSVEGNNNRDNEEEAKSQLSRILASASLDFYQNGNAAVWSSCASAPWSLVHSTIGQKPLQLKLLARTGLCVGIDSSGRVAGFDANDSRARLFVRPVADGTVRLQSAETGRYLAFNSTGRLYGELNMNKDSNEWEQWRIGNYSALRSRPYAELDWWLGIKRNGRHVPGPKSTRGHTTWQFLPIVL